MKKAMIAIMLCTMLTGCSKTLSREKAKDLIWAYNHYDEGIQFEIVLTTGDLAELTKRGIVGKTDLTPLGRQIFTVRGHYSLVTVAKVHPAVEVTGISGDETKKEVEFTVQWFAELRSEVKDIFKDRQPEAHAVTIQLYDDGWRVVRLER
jgi:hypothetical protein